MVALAAAPDPAPDPAPRPRIALITPERYAVFRNAPVVEAFARAGFDIDLSPDSDTLPDADILLLAGSVGSLRRTVRALERHPAPPPAISWIAEPLPPVDLRRWAEPLGLMLSPMRWGLTWGKLPMMVLSRPVFSLIAWFGRPRGADPLPAGALQFVLNNQAWVQRGLARGWLTRVGVTTRQRVQYLANRGIEAAFLPAGLNASYGEDRRRGRDIDVLFIGRTKLPGRRQRLDDLVRTLRARGHTVEVRTGDTYGEDRTRLVNRAKVMLNINNYAWDTAWMRWYLATANGAAVASEPQSVAAPLRPGIDYLEAPFDTLADEITELLADEPRRRAMVEACRATMTAQMTTDVTARRIFAIVQDLIPA